MRSFTGDLEGGYGEEGTESERGEDPGHNLCHRPCPYVELRRVLMPSATAV